MARMGGGKLGRYFLIGVSFLFYFLLIPKYLPLLIISILFNFTIGFLLIHLKKNSRKHEDLIYILWIGLIGDLLILGYYKYISFAIINLEGIGLSIPVPDIILPLGISFFTFTQIAFLVDTYRGLVKKVDLLSYTQFVTFFPHLIAGPIYHHTDIIPQFGDNRKYLVNWENINLGIFFFFFGLAKKVIIADTLATIATPIFSAVADGGTPMLFEAWIGALAYSLQLYFDFSGYSDMAIGIALLFNIRFPLNFFSPYKVTSIIDFWRCWHITLSNWLRDYLYIPLGGNRYGFPVQMRSIIITFLLGGLWHGAGWTFIIWGGFHGVCLICNHIWRKTGIVLNTYICWAITFLTVVIGWVFFRADSVKSALVMLKGMFGGYGVSIPQSLPDFGLFIHSGLINVAPVKGNSALLIVGAGLAISLLLPNLYEMTEGYHTVLVNDKQSSIKIIEPFKTRILYQQSMVWAIIVGFVAVIAIISMQTDSEFLYFRF